MGSEAAKLFEVRMWFGGFAGVEPHTCKFFVAAGNFDEAVALVRSEYQHGRLEACNQLGAVMIAVSRLSEGQGQ